MAKFAFAVLTNDPNRLNVISTKLGSRVGTTIENKAGLGEYSDAEIKKAVKLGTQNNYLLCADGDELDAFVDNIDAGGTEDGWTFGGVARGNVGQRHEVQVASGVATPLVIGDLVVAGTQLPVGTKGLAQVKKGTPALHKYRVMRILTGTGVAGDKVLIEKV
jgi:hypothetical protein